MPLPVLDALLSLGKKYDLRQLHGEARTRVFKSFPITLREHDAAATAVSNDFEWPPDHSWYHLLVIARRARLVSILPQVLYECQEYYETAEILNGFTSREDPEGPVVGQFTDKEGKLLLAGSIAIRKASVETTYKWLYGPGNLYSSCKTPKRCHKTRQDTRNSLSGSGAEVPSPLDEWKWARLEINDDLCDDCNKDAQREHEAGRKKFWERLPSCFGLPPWADLWKETQDM